MRFSHLSSTGNHDYELRVSPGTEPTVAELAGALGESTDGLFIDGRLRTGALADAGLTEGGVVSATAPADALAGPDEPTLDVVGGIDAGGRHGLGRRRIVAGRSSAADISLSSSTVSPFHLAIDPCSHGVRVTDLDSRNGTLVDGEWLLEPVAVEADQVLDLGACHLAARQPVDDAPLGLVQVLGRTPSGTFSFNRPPRRAAAEPGPPIPAPGRPRPQAHRALFSWASFIAPLVFGLLMAMLLNPLFALFALLSPVMAVATWAESRRRSSKESKRTSATVRRGLERLAIDLAEARRREQSRRRRVHPDPAEVCRRAALPSTRLWERRLGDTDALQLVVGSGDLDWVPPLDIADGDQAAEGVASVLEDDGPLRAVPVVVDVGAGRVIGLVGQRVTTLAIARSLVVQAAVHHGPVDLAVRVAAAEGVDAWGWATWLPHTRDRHTGGRTRTVAVGRDQISRLAAADGAAGDQPTEHIGLLVIDGDGLATGRTSPARAMLGGLGGPTGAIVVASTLDRLPSMCTTVVEVVDPDGLIRVSEPDIGLVLDDVLATGIDAETAEGTARRLARFDDPELALADASIPPMVSLLELLDMTEPSADAIERRWCRTRGTDELRAPIGADGHGVLEVDLVRDGPHGLIGGTTGSGKSELLRSLVASLAASADSDHLNFVLIDYKGGSAFDRCAALPHTVGLVTDLDEHLGARALRCLEAELHRRERVLRAAGADDIGDYLSRPSAGSPAEPLPRLVVVIDEFATMAAELPDFIDALVGVAQRGRSLGVHLLLATQRPSGAVNANIRTNTNLRIALRVLDPGDSSDVIDVRDAAAIGRDQPGRACARFGPGEVVAFQSALVTGLTPQRSTRSLELFALVDGTPVTSPEPHRVDTRSDLDRLVDAIGEAHLAMGLQSPRRPWPEPLPTDLHLEDLPPRPDQGGIRGVTVGLSDEPDRQRQSPATFDPAEGNALLLGIPGSGTTTALATIAVAMAARHRADELHIFAIDHGAGGLGTLRSLPHCGAVANASEPERQARLIRHLVDELIRRRALDPAEVEAEPTILVLVDNLGGFRNEYEESRDYELVDQLTRVYADGPPLDIRMVAAADQPNGAPRAMTAVTSQIWLMRFTDPSDYAAFGVRPPAGRSGDSTAMPPGRAFRSETGVEIQFALPHRDGLAAAVDHIAAGTDPPRRPPARIGILPLELMAADLDRPTQLVGDPTFLPVGMGDDRLATVGFELHEGEHALIAGPARSGKSTALATIGRLAADAGARVIAVAGPRSPLGHIGHRCELVRGADELITALEGAEPGTIALVDDADQLDDLTSALAALLARGRPGVHVVAAGRADRLRAAYGHWTAVVRGSRTGVLLSPDVLDGDLLGVQLPPRVQLPPLPGRGWLIANGSMQVCQLAAAEPVEQVDTQPVIDVPTGLSFEGLAAGTAPSRAVPQRSKRTRSS